jgi:hypothetical protein
MRIRKNCSRCLQWISSLFAGAISTHRLIYRYRIKSSHVVSAASNVISHFLFEKGDGE